MMILSQENKVNNNIWNSLKPYCRKSEPALLKDFKKQNFEVTELSNGSYYAFQDNGSNVLAVAHMDISFMITSRRKQYQRSGQVVISPALDDRLGVFILNKILPQFGVLPDILLTTDEEIGRSTAGDFHPVKDYNWMFSFDRSGTDVVLYQYETLELGDILEDMGFKVGFGSFSDISSLDHLGVSGFNFGTGYYLEHTKSCHALLDETRMMIALFVDFYNTYKDVRFEYVPVDRDYGWQQWLGEESHMDEYWDTHTESWHPINYDVMESWAYGTKHEAMRFYDKHENMGHEVDWAILDDTHATAMCYDCDSEIIFKDTR
jgi:hypothetical protein